MSAGGLFAMGLLVTVIVAIGVGLPLVGAILASRDQAEPGSAEVQQLPDASLGRRPAA